MIVILIISIIITTVKYPNHEFVSPNSFLPVSLLGFSHLVSLSIHLSKSEAHH
jgi:hypothetical protein